MPNPIVKYFPEYRYNKSKFDDFHNNVINMPRANFGQLRFTICLLKSLASYILMIPEEKLKVFINYKEIYHLIYNNYLNNVLPVNNRDQTFENDFLAVSGDFDSIYNKYGRMFRHYMEYLAFFGFVRDGKNRQTKIIDIDGLRELVLTPNNILYDSFRNRLLNININDNDFIKNLKGITIQNDADYKPADAIIYYCKELNREVTDFEISLLLGRIDNVQKQSEILKRAIEIGEYLPTNYNDQQKVFFGCMGWKSNSGVLYEYAQSQSPNFKFKVFLLFMDVFGLINYNQAKKTIELTDYSKRLQQENIDFDILDLQHLLSLIDDDTTDSNQLIDLIIRKRTKAITKAIQDDGELVIKLNKRNIRNPIIKNGKRQRNKLIAELVKIKSNYLDELTKQLTFEDKYGKNYVEAHHIIEFNGENGPDVTDNLICLGPENHSLIHHGSSRAVDEFYKKCRENGVISLEQFKNIITLYKSLTKDHVKVLIRKGLISKEEATELNRLIDIFKVDKTFLKSIGQ